MKKIFLFLFLSLIMAGLTYADDQQGLVPMFGDADAYAANQPTNTETGMFSSYTLGRTDSGSTGGGGGVRRSKTGEYDVQLQVAKTKYKQGEKVKAKITVLNTKNKIVEGTSLTYYLTDPDGEKLEETKQQLIKLLPTDYDECKEEGGVIEEETSICTNIFTEEITLPKKAVFGTWKFNAEFEDPNQATIKVYSNIEVTESESLLKPKTFLFGIMAVLLFLNFRKKR